jgi:O-antigen/teichoic acid export membrane protein
MVGVLFPAFSTTLMHDQKRTKELFSQGINYIFLALFLPCLIIATLAHEGLAIWLGTDFAQHSAIVVQWLTFGMFVNSLAQVPFSLIQGLGRPDITAKLHFIELPFYLFGVWWLTVRYGIEGTAVAWVLRATMDMTALGIATWWVLPDTFIAIRRSAIMIIISLVIYILAVFIIGIFLKVLFLISALIIFFPSAWFLILTDQERTLLKNRFRAIHL